MVRTEASTTERKIRVVLLFAAMNHLAFAALTLGDPFFYFKLFEVLPLWPTLVSHGIALAVVLIGILLIVALMRPQLRVALVKLTLFAKIVPMLLWAGAFYAGFVPLTSFALIFFNDLIWWLPLLFILRSSRQALPDFDSHSC